jgi:hypothetical protein
MRKGKYLIWILIVMLVIQGFLLSGCSKTDDPCLGTEPHPIGVNIAVNYDVDYAQVMDWYCAGSGFDDIILALETVSLDPDVQVDELLQSIDEGNSWDEIWETLDLAH